MALCCRPGKHVPIPDGVRNQGFEFSQCQNCRRDLLRSDRRWKAVPKGFHVVWRGRTWCPRANAAEPHEFSTVSISLAVPVFETRRRGFPAMDLVAVTVSFLVMMAVERLRSLWASFCAPPLVCQPVRRLANASQPACA